MATPLPGLNWRKIKTDFALSFSSQVVYKLIGFLVLAMLTRYLPKEEMGQFYFAAALATFSSIFTELGTNTYMIREVARAPGSAQALFSAIASLRVPLIGIYFLALNGFVYFLTGDLWVIVFLTSVYVMLEEIYMSMGSLFLAIKRVVYNVISGVSTRFLLLGAIAIVVVYKGTITSILSAYIIANTVLAGIAVYILLKNIGGIRLRWNPESMKALLKNASPFFVLNILALVHFKVDVLMLGTMTSYTEVATYESAFRLLEAARFPLWTISAIFFPLFSELAANETWSDLRSLSKRLLLGSGLAGVGVALVIITASALIIPLVFGTGYRESVPVLRILYLSVPMIYMSRVSGLLSRAIRLEKRIVHIMISCVILNIVLNLGIIPIWGASGAASTTVITETALALWLMRLNHLALRGAERGLEKAPVQKGFDHAS